MKNIPNVISAIFVVMAILSVSFFLSCDNKNAQDGDSPVTFIKGDSVEALPIAYVNVDSLLTHYNLYIEATEKLNKKSQSAEATLRQKQKQLENEVADFQRKLQNNAFLSEDRARQEQTRIQKLEIELNNLAQRLQNDIAKEQIQVNNQIADSVRLSLKEYNKTANFEMILSNTGMDNVLFAKDVYDITKQITDLLNSRYKSEVSK